METPPPVSPTAPDMMPPIVPNPAEAAAANVAAETAANAEQAGRASRVMKGIGSVAVNNVAPALGRAFGRAGRNLGAMVGATAEAVGNMAEAGAHLTGRVARGIGSAAYSGYARVQTTLGTFQAGARPSASKANTAPLWGVPPPPPAAKGHELRRAFGHSMRTAGLMGGMAIGAVLAARHGIHMPNTGGSGTHAASELAGNQSHGFTVGMDSLPDTGHVNAQMAAHSGGIGSDHAGNVVFGILGTGVASGALYGGARAYRSHRDHMYHYALNDHNLERKHDAAQIRGQAGARQFQDIRVSHRTGPKLRDENTVSGAPGSANRLLNGAPVVKHPYSHGAGTTSRSPRRVGPNLPYDPEHLRGRRILERGDEENRDHPLGGHH